MTNRPIGIELQQIPADSTFQQFYEETLHAPKLPDIMSVIFADKSSIVTYSLNNQIKNLLPTTFANQWDGGSEEGLNRYLKVRIAKRHKIPIQGFLTVPKYSDHPSVSTPNYKKLKKGSPATNGLAPSPKRLLLTAATTSLDETTWYNKQINMHGHVLPTNQVIEELEEEIQFLRNVVVGLADIPSGFSDELLHDEEVVSNNSKLAHELRRMGRAILSLRALQLLQ